MGRGGAGGLAEITEGKLNGRDIQRLLVLHREVRRGKRRELETMGRGGKDLGGSAGRGRSKRGRHESFCPVALMPYCRTALLPYCPLSLLRCCPVALLFCHPVILLHCSSVAPLPGPHAPPFFTCCRRPRMQGTLYCHPDPPWH